jgi:YD repeat-containing protein
MKKTILLLTLIALISSCNSDDSETSQNNNAPLGKLIKTETTFTVSGETDVVYNSYTYDDIGRVSGINYGIENTTTLVNYLYNDEGQIWKENLNDGTSREYQYTNGLITSITLSNSETNIELIYDNNSQLIQAKFYDGDIFQSDKNFTNDSNGNVLSISGGTSLTTYEYDNMDNPLNAAFENQEYNKISHVFPLIPPINTTNNIISKSGSFNSTLTHTYSTNGFPLTTEEILPNGDSKYVTYTYQE